jgi:hypothetical protein
MVKFVALMRRRPGMTHEEFVDYHRNHHAKTYMSDPTRRSSGLAPGPPPRQREVR